MDKGCHFNLDERRRRREPCNLHQSAGRRRCTECFMMCSGDMIGISEIGGINDGSDNMAQLRPSLTKCHSHRCDGGRHLNIGIGL